MKYKNITRRGKWMIYEEIVKNVRKYNKANQITENEIKTKDMGDRDCINILQWRPYELL